jgi:hypothetical protein
MWSAWYRCGPYSFYLVELVEILVNEKIHLGVTIRPSRDFIDKKSLPFERHNSGDSHLIPRIVI